MEISFRYVREQLEIKGKEVERLHQLLDQSQQLLLNEQKKNQLLLESKAEPADWEEEKTHLEKQVSSYQKSLSEANRIANNNYAYAENMERWFWVVRITAGIFFCDNTSSDLDSLFLSMSKLTFWGQLFVRQ